MEIQEYQEWLRSFYKERGWYSLSPFIRANFLSEETGEVARAIRTLEIGRDRPDEQPKTTPEQLHHLAEELGDVLDNVFILADKYQLQLEDILTANKEKLLRRFHS